jgi:hypothetical protein
MDRYAFPTTDWILVSAPFVDATQVHSANGTVTATTRPTVSISVRYFQRREGIGDRGWGIIVNHSESSSISHQPHTYPSRVRREKIGRWNASVQFCRAGMTRSLVSMCRVEPGGTMGSKVRSPLPITPLPNRAGKVPFGLAQVAVR